MPEARHRTIDSLGLPIHLLEWGNLSGEPIVLLHGFLDQAQSWKFFVEQLLRRTGRPPWIVAPDCRGHGDSGWVGAGGYYHFPDYVYDLQCVIDSLGAERVTLVGHSMGGTISFLYAGAFPARVTRLVLIEGIGPPAAEFADAPLRMVRWISEVRARGRHHFREYSSVEAGAAQLRQTNPRLKEEFAIDLARFGMRRTANDKWVWKFDPLHRTAAPQPFYTAQAAAFLRRIACPVLIVDGSESRQIRRTDKQQRYQAIGDYRISNVSDSGHMVHHDNPAELAEIIVTFLGLGLE